MECICLAGGLGTRLQPVLPDTPKCLAPIGDRAFLDILLQQLKRQGARRVILSLGYLHETVLSHIHNREYNIHIDVSIETEPLGTAGALRKALATAVEGHVIVVNGDTYFDVDCQQLLDFHQSASADVTLSLKRLHNFDRYGRVEVLEGRVTGFHEKTYCPEGLVNGGVYAVRKDIQLPERGSFEKDYLAQPGHQLYGREEAGLFIDIGVPDDYQRAQHVLAAIEQNNRHV